MVQLSLPTLLLTRLENLPTHRSHSKYNSTLRKQDDLHPDDYIQIHYFDRRHGEDGN